MELDGNKPKVIFPLKAYQQMCAYVDLCKDEVQWFFNIDWSEEDNAFKIGEVFLLEQEASAAHIESDEETVSKFMEELMKADPELEQMPRGWGHSHVDMEAFFSGTDEDTIDQLTNDSFSFSIVMNKSRKYSNCLKITTPYFKVRFDNIPITIDYPHDIDDQWKKEVETKVKTKAIIKLPWEKKNKTNKKSGAILDFPKDRIEALAKIEKLNMYRTWDSELNEVLWKEIRSEQRWRDRWSVLEDEAIEFMEKVASHKPLFKGTHDWANLGDTQLRCTKCSYIKSFHKNSKDCQDPIYEPL